MAVLHRIIIPKGRERAAVRTVICGGGVSVRFGDPAGAVSLLAGQGASPGITGAFLPADRLARMPSIEEATAAFLTGRGTALADVMRS